MLETPENTAAEPPVAAARGAPPGPSPWLRPWLFGALFGMGILVGVVAMSATGPASNGEKSTAKAPRLITPSVKATQSTPAPAAMPAKVTAEPIVVAGSVADEFGRALVDALILVGRDVPQVSPNGERPDVGELGVTSGPVPAVPGTTTVTPPRDAATARTDQDGKFSITVVEVGNVQVYVSQPGYEPALLTLEGLRPGETRDQLYVVLRAPLEALPVEPIAPADPNLARISGVVIDRLGQPVAGALVETDEGEARTQSGADGAFELTGVAPGALRVMATDDSAGHGESAEIRARPGELLPGVRLHLPGRHVPGAAPSAALATRSPVSDTLATRVPPPALPPVPVLAPKSTPAPVLQAGVALEQRSNSVVVSMVDQNSAGGQAGLLAGDNLLRVDNEPVLSASQARGMLRDPSGVIVRVQVLRGKKRLNLRWKRPGVRYVPGPDVP